MVKKATGAWLWGFIPNLTKRWKKPRQAGYPQNPQTLGEQIRKRRMNLGLFQEDVAKLIKVTTDCITNWENNRSVPQIQFYPAIISFLGFYPFEIDTTLLSGQIRHYRYVHGLSRKKMGALLQIDSSTIGSWEDNDHIPQAQLKRRLLELLQEDN